MLLLFGQMDPNTLMQDFHQHRALSSAMFKILELKSQSSAPPTQVGGEFGTREDALAAVKRHLKSFKVSGHNPEGSYWWARDSEGLRKCWIAGG